jgi:predicted TPR repeat methyltransferase
MMTRLNGCRNSYLQQALELMPDDGEVCFNIAAVLESTGEIDEALVAYGRARMLGIERAAINERNVSPIPALCSILK